MTVALGFVGGLVLLIGGAEALAPFSTVMLWFVMPLTVLTVGVTVTRSLRHRLAAR